jgi:hypothetical protein
MLPLFLTYFAVTVYKYEVQKLALSQSMQKIFPLFLITTKQKQLLVYRITSQISSTHKIDNCYT